MAKQSNVDRVYLDIRTMAAQFELKPDEKLNETSMATKLGTSRTPLREALNRLVSEGFLTFQKGRGFFCRSLSASEILDLYQAREAVECKLIALACERATHSDLEKLQEFLIECEDSYHKEVSPEELVELDERFHMQIAKLAQNRELMRILENLNARMRFVRTIDLEKRRVVTPKNHMEIMQAMLDGDVEKSIKSMQVHIVRSSEEATQAVRAAYARIYVPDSTVS